MAKFATSRAIADHPINKGVLCAKGSAGIMQHYSPARLRAPLLRTGPRGSGEFREISWDEALKLAVDWLQPIRDTSTAETRFFYGPRSKPGIDELLGSKFRARRIMRPMAGSAQSTWQPLAFIQSAGHFGSLAHRIGTTKLFVLFGVAEDHDSNPDQNWHFETEEGGARFVSVNPVRTGYSAIADNWIGIRPGTDGLLVLSIIHELFRTGKIDLDDLARYTNAPWLVIDNEGHEDHGLFLRDDLGKALIRDRKTGAVVRFDEPGHIADLNAEFTTADGLKVRSVLRLMAEKYLDPKYAPEAVATETGVSATIISGLASEIARVAFEEEIIVEQPWIDMKGEQHEVMIGRPVSFHAMRGISAHSNGFQSARALHVLQTIIGSIDCPGGYRYKPPYPKPATAHPRPHGRSEHVTPGNLWLGHISDIHWVRKICLLMLKASRSG